MRYLKIGFGYLGRSNNQRCDVKCFPNKIDKKYRKLWLYFKGNNILQVFAVLDHCAKIAEMKGKNTLPMVMAYSFILSSNLCLER